ncbi:type I protein arginine methyltransferase [Salvia divinorum]|uniref:Type I protein arginine methyltransferase n=1 Tax=Salvia divinorum TaxID=28513 RepID=A0ABD1FHP5_SALDI
MDIKNNGDASVSGSLDNLNLPTKIKFQYDEDEEAETIEEVAINYTNLDKDSTMCNQEESLVSGDDKTSVDYYFDSYSHFGILFMFFVEFQSDFITCGKQEMLKDVIRTKTYQNLIYKNSFFFKDKIVLDVGAGIGTGMLSLLCAKVCAKHVYAIECSSMASYNTRTFEYYLMYVMKR